LTDVNVDYRGTDLLDRSNDCAGVSIQEGGIIKGGAPTGLDGCA